jgi:SNF2 family DNA or RNA helicase
MRFKPHDYQVYTIEQIKKKPKIALILDMGLGKTVCTLTAINDLMYDSFDIGKVLVIAPLRVADMTWPDEVEKWDHLKYLRISKVIGSAAKRVEALEKRADIYIINRENTKWLIDYYLSKTKKWPFDTIVIDESSSFKNHQSQRFKALKKAAAVSKRVIELTGTPAPNSLMDLWSQIYLLDQGERLGQSITKYRNMYFYPDKRNQVVVFSYKPKPGAEKEIYKQIGDIAVSLKASDHIKMPDRIDNFIKLKMSKRIRAIYEEMERNYLVSIDEEMITATSAGVVSNKLLQMANGAAYDEDRKVIHIHDLKLEALEEIIEENDKKPILVLYNYQHDHQRLIQRFEKLKPRELETKKDLDDWNNGSIQILLAHPASMGHGLNLQAGGNIIVWFGLTYSLESYLQANARLYRQGQKETVIINHLITEDTEDENAIQRLTQKRMNQDELIEAVKAKIRKAKGGQHK